MSPAGDSAEITAILDREKPDPGRATKIRADAEAVDPILNLSFRGQHQDGAIEAAFTDPGADFEAIGAGQHDIEDDQIESVFEGEAKTYVAVFGPFDLVSCSFEQIAHGHGDAPFIFDKKNP